MNQTRKKKTFPKAPTGTVNRIVTYIENHCGNNRKMFGELVGVSGGAVYSWIKEVKAPAYMKHVMDALEAEKAPGEKPTRRAVVIAGNSEHIDAVVTLAEALKLQNLEISDF